MNSPGTEPAPLAFGPFVLDRAAGRLLQHGQPVALAPKPRAVLNHLVERPQQLVTKDELLDAVWGHRHVSDSAPKMGSSTPLVVPCGTPNRALDGCEPMSRSLNAVENG